MPSTFDFHYVYTPTGSISGPSVLTQTEDAINDLGEYMSQSTTNADEALRQAKQAVNTANTAQQNASEARSTADSALSRVQTLTVTVESWDGRVTTAESNAQNAVTTANSALANAGQAVTTANSANATSQQAVTTANSALSTATQANTNSTQAVGTASSALTTAQDAVSIARQAVTDTDAIREEINADMETINSQVAAATAQAQTAQSAAAQAQGASDLSERWATSTANRGSEAEPDFTVDGDDYSSKWYALNVAQQWAAKMDGQVTADGTPGGTPVDYSAKYYAAKAKEGAESAGDKASAAAQSATAAASSAEKAASFAGYSFRYSELLGADSEMDLAFLYPSRNAKVGDHVVNAQGAVFEIETIGDLTFAVGPKITSLQGPKGPMGDGIQLNDAFNSLEELLAQIPTGKPGQTVLVGNKIYTWSGTLNQWVASGDLTVSSKPPETIPWGQVTDKPPLTSFDEISGEDGFRLEITPGLTYSLI
jgi:hypothetical protein